MVGDIGREQERIAAADDHLLALVRSAPIDFHSEFVGADDFGRIREAVAHLGEERHIAVRVRTEVGESSVGELGSATRNGAIDERHRAWIVPLLGLGRHRRSEYGRQ